MLSNARYYTKQHYERGGHFTTIYSTAHAQ